LQENKAPSRYRAIIQEVPPGPLNITAKNKVGNLLLIKYGSLGSPEISIKNKFHTRYTCNNKIGFPRIPGNNS
jgi:hypothetical protein